MTEKRRAAIAKEFRRKLDKNVLRKNAIRQICAKHSICRRSLYNYCESAGVSTR